MKNKIYFSPCLSFRPVTPVTVILSPAVSLLTLGVTNGISRWSLVEVTMSSGSVPFNFFRFLFDFDGAGGYKTISISYSNGVCVCVRACACMFTL